MSSVDSLATLRDIRLPPEHVLWLAPQWWLGAALFSLAAAAALAWYLRRRRRLRALRLALQELSRLAAAYARDRDAVGLARGLSRLLRGYAVMRFPHANAAGLTGGAWLQFLDAHGGGSDFCVGAGAALETLPYRPHGELDAAALVAAVRRWLQANPS